MHRTLRLPVALAACAVLGSSAQAEEPALSPPRLLVLPRVSGMANDILPVDPVQARIVRGAWTPPRAGDAVTLPDGGTRVWQEIAPGADGAYQHAALAGGYAYWPVTAGAPRVAILEASGHSSVWVNGESRAGDVYGYGYVRLPVLLKPGANHLLFRGGRGRLAARLVEPEGPLALDTRDATLPDLREGRPLKTWGAVVVLNATDAPVDGLTLEARVGRGKAVSTPLPVIGPLTVRKVGFRIEAPGLAAGEVPLTLTLKGRNGEASRAALTLRVRKIAETFKQTFVSRIDGSVQYFGVNPATPEPAAPPALILSLHGASVEAIGQADAYSSKKWATLVAPTNRRPYGYDWEDWGRMDAMEVLDIARATLDTDPARTYLTGHSMGGHGAWQVGALYPGRFAAIGPSAGWISVHTYGRGGRPSDTVEGVADILRRAAAVGDTENFVANYADAGVYILHGDADETVSVEQARTMRRLLEPLHEDLRYHEEPGQGHWWDLSDEPGADCVDWAPMLDFFARHALPPLASVRRVDFTTANPAVSATSHWATVEMQDAAMRPSRVVLECDPHLRRITGTTANVRRLALDLLPLMPGAVTLELDGQRLEGIAPKGPVLHLRREGGRWSVANPAAPALKGPRRYGPFRHAFDRRMLFVYGTRGTPGEKAWAYARARFDAETWWYRGNGSVDVIPDTAFRADHERDRSVILYGNAVTNRAWPALLADSPVTVMPGEVRVGERVFAADDLACLFLRPRPGSETALVGVVGGTGLAGMRLTESLPYLHPMVGFPDALVVGADVLERGLGGVRAAGFFGEDWGVPSGDFAWGQ